MADALASTGAFALSFQSTTFEVVDQHGQPWLRASEIGAALGYADDKAIQRIFGRHSDEFTNNMTGVVKLTTPSGAQESRIFSLRGAHLLAMFARTQIAKQFRKWVLDILERQPATATPYTVQPSDALNEPQQIALRAMLESNVKRLPHAKQAGAMIKGWSKLKAHFGVPYRQIPASEFEEALSIVARHVSEWELVDEVPKPSIATALAPEESHTKAAFDAATQAAASVQTAVFNAVLSGNDEWKYSRWLLAFATDNKIAAPAIVQKLPNDAFATSWATLTHDIAGGECLRSTPELLAMASACMHRLQQRSSSARLAA